MAHLDFAAHAHKGHERRILLNVLEQDDIAVLAGEVLGLAHEEDVAAARLLALRRAPLLHLALVFVERLDAVEGGVVGERSVGVALERPPVELAQFDGPHVGGHEGPGELDRGGGVLQEGSSCGPLSITVRIRYFSAAGKCGGLRIRSIFGRIRIQQIRILKTGSGSYWHLKNQFKHQNIFHIKHISSYI